MSNHFPARALWTIAGVGVGHYENFPVASMLCPPRLREPIRCIYAFARTADDIADEGDMPAGERLALLARYRQALRDISREPYRPGDADAPAARWGAVFGPLSSSLREFALPTRELLALLDAFEQDVRNPAYANREQLLDYCARSANPVGRLLLHLYGIDDADAIAESDAICSALQLINFWQDLSLDLPRGRVYLPLGDCGRHGVDAAWLRDGRDDAAARALVADLVRWSGALLARGAALPRRVPGRAGWELRLVMHGGWRILEKIARMHFRSFARRPTLSARDGPVLLWRATRHSTEQFRPDMLR